MTYGMNGWNKEIPGGDLISRAAAIEVLNELARVNFTLGRDFAFYLGALHDAADGIKKLPSANGGADIRGEQE